MTTYSTDGSIDMKTYRINTTGTYVAQYVVEADSAEDAIQQFKNGFDENFSPEYQDDERVIKVEEY